MNAPKHPMYFIGLSVCAYIGWKQMTEALDTWEEALYTMPDREGEAITPAYLNPDNWVIDEEQY